jgi:sulfite reductase alpha subunit-like flavoprotein
MTGDEELHRMEASTRLDCDSSRANSSRANSSANSSTNSAMEARTRVDWETGDHVAVYPRNPPALVQRLLVK